MRSYIRIWSFWIFQIAFLAHGQTEVAPSVQSERDLVGKWISKVQTPDFAGTSTLKVRADGTFVLIVDGNRSGERAGGVRRGTWRWTGAGPTVQLSDSPRPLDLLTF